MLVHDWLSIGHAIETRKQQNKELSKLAELVGDIKFAMLTTMEKDGSLRSRPLATLQMDEEGQLWFFTSVSSPKADEVEHHHNVNVSYAHPEKQDYISVSGVALILRDKDKMKELWTPWIKPWFPGGLDDPDLVLLKVTIQEAEYWDAPGSAVKRAYGFAKAILTGNTDALGDNKKIKALGE